MTTATKATHTPGPWRITATTAGNIVQEVDIRGPRNFDNSSVLVATLSDVNESDENARLIAAAPEMLEALEACMRCLGLVDSSETDVEALNLAEAAIRKARGEQ